MMRCLQTAAMAAALALAGPATAQGVDRPGPPRPASPTITGSAATSGLAPSIPLAGTLTDKAIWKAYKARFVSDRGRVIDTANGGISHSEGQGYGMLLAVAAGDRDAFDAIWGWTRANLMVRDDELIAWRWEANERPAVADMNDASDGDLLVAWALTEAAEAWHDIAYRVAARRIAVEVGRKLIVPRTNHGALLLPGLWGFAAEDRPDGPVINLSYWVFPAFERLPIVAPDIDWAGLSRNGLELVKQVRFGPANLPTEWVSLREDLPRPADGFTKTFAYNAIRIPLYIAWAGLGQREIYEPFILIWKRSNHAGLPIIDTTTGQPTDWMADKSYAAVAALTACAANPGMRSSETRAVQMSDPYYSVTLNLLASIAGHMRYPSCFDN